MNHKNAITPQIISSEQRRKSANKVTFTGSVLNLLLSLVKLLAGFLGRSHAMIADAVHSLSDLGTDIAVFIGIYLSSQPSDKSHNYGHGKFETFATLIIALTLLSVGVGIGFSGIEKIIATVKGEPLESPRLIAFSAAIISVIIKEGLFRYTIKKGTKLNSSSLIANAYHHRSDAYSSLGTSIGIGSAILLGPNWAVLDPIAAAVVSVLIIKEAISIGYTSINDLLEASLPDEDQSKIIDIAAQTAGVINPHNLKSRRIGNTIALDLHIRVDGKISVLQGHSIAHNVQDAILKEFGSDVICSIHVEPE